MQPEQEYITSLVDQGGPMPSQYEELNLWFQGIGEQVRAGSITRKQIRTMWTAFGEAFSMDTMQGLVAIKPYGYAGDFEIIDKIYTNWISPKEQLVNWDKFFHWHKATVAVRNRKEYFKKLLAEQDQSEQDQSDVSHLPIVLNVGCGPCRDIYEYLQEKTATNIRFECLDIDERAVNYSKSILKNSSIECCCKNAFRFKPNKKYDLVWSAGLFDYLEDKQFIFLLRLLLDAVSPDGKIVIGNFSEANPSRDYMEFGEWFLHHRTEDRLVALANQAGCSDNSITIEKEATGVNLFLRVRKA